MAATDTPAHLKLRWRPPSGSFRRADGAEYKEAAGHKGTYEWVTKDGLHSAYHYPNGSQVPEVLIAPQTSWKRAYRACVEHNKKGVVDRSSR